LFSNYNHALENIQTLVLALTLMLHSWILMCFHLVTAGCNFTAAARCWLCFATIHYHTSCVHVAYYFLFCHCLLQFCNWCLAVAMHLLSYASALQHFSFVTACFNFATDICLLQLQCWNTLLCFTCFSGHLALPPVIAII